MNLDNLHTAVELLAAHPDLPTPCVFAYSTEHVDVTWQLMNNDATKDDQAEAARQIMRAIGGTWNKKPWDDRFDFERKYEGISLEIYASREQVCERVVVGTETVTIPAVEAQPQRTEERELVEWRCEPILAATSDERQAVAS